MSEPRFADGIRQRNLPRSRADIHDFIDKTDDGVEKLFSALRDIVQAGASSDNASPPTILLSLDQGEELFNDEGRDEAKRFIEIVSKVLTADPRTLASSPCARTLSVCCRATRPSPPCRRKPSPST